MKRFEKRSGNGVNGFEALQVLASRRTDWRSDNLCRRMSAGYYIRKFGLKFKEADSLSSFLYLVIAEEDRRFLLAMECWVREISLTKGSIQAILENLVILKVCRIDSRRAEYSCRRVRREIIRYVELKYRRGSEKIRK